MKNLSLTLVIFLVLLLIGCQDQTDIVESPLNDSDGSYDLSKVTILNQIEVIIPLSGTRFIPCINGGVGEDVDVSGTAKLELVEFLDGNGGFHGRVSFQTLEYESVGQITGDVYQGVGGKERQTLYINPSGYPYTTNFTANYNFHGPNNNYREHVNAAFVVNANGEITADFFTVSIDCN